MGVVSPVTWSQYNNIDPLNFNEKHKCYVELELELEHSNCTECDWSLSNECSLS